MMLNIDNREFASICVRRFLNRDNINAILLSPLGRLRQLIYQNDDGLRENFRLKNNNDP